MHSSMLKAGEINEINEVQQLKYTEMNLKIATNILNDI